MYGKYDSFNYAWNDAVRTAGYREMYAIEHGTRTLKWDGGHRLWVFKYSTEDSYQDGNGATFDTTEGRWVG